MTFHHSSYSSSFSGSYDETCHNFWSPPDRRRSFYSYPPDLGTVSCQNVDLNYCHIPPRNVPCATHYEEFCNQLPYANQTWVPNGILSSQWADIGNGETDVSPSPEYCSRFLNSRVPDYYNVRRSLSLPDPVYSRFLQLGREYHTRCNADFNYGLSQQSSDIGFINSDSVVSPSQIQNRHPPTFQHRMYPFQHEEMVNTGIGDYFPVSHNYSFDEIMQNTLASSAKLTAENRNTLGIQSAFLGGSNIQHPIVSRYSPTEQLFAKRQNFEADYGAETFSNFSIVDCIANSEPEAISRPGMAEIPLFLSSRQTFTDFAVSGGEGSQQADCKFSSSSVSGTQVSPVSMSADQSISQAVLEIPKPREERIMSTPSITSSDSTWIESACCSRDLSPCFSDMSSAVIGSMGGCDMPVNEDKQIDLSEAEMNTSCVESSGTFTINTSETLNAMHLGNWQSQAETSEETQLISAVNSAPAILTETDSAHAVRNRELMPDVTDTSKTRESDGMIANASDSVILLSPLAVAHEPTSTVSVNPGNSVGEPYCCRMQPTCVQVPHCGSSQLVPISSHNFSTFRNPYVLLTRANHITDHSYSAQTNSCQRHPYHQAVSYISTNSYEPCADSTTCGYVKPMFCHAPVTAVSGHRQMIRRHSTERKGLLHLTNSSQNHDLSQPQTCNRSVGSSSHYSMLQNSQQNLGLKKTMLMPVASSQAHPHIAWSTGSAQKHASVTSASRNVCSTSACQLPLISPPVRTDINQSHYKSHSLPVYRRNSSAMQLRDMALRRNGTYSIRAARILLHQLKQPKLLDFTKTCLARRQLFSRRFSLPSNNGAVIDLTADDDIEEDTVESCERIFARARRHRIVTNHVLQRLRHSLRLNSFQRISPADNSCHDPKHQTTAKTFAVDKSLPFYRCFVQSLMRKYRFTSSGVPITVYPEMLPPALPRVSFVRRDVHKPADIDTQKGLMENKEPVIVLKRLDRSVLSEGGTVNVKTSQSDVCSLAANHETEAENCIHVTRANANSGHRSTEPEWTGKETIQRENASVKLTANRCRHDYLTSLCRPVSVVLERLDRIKIRQICNELCKIKPYCQDGRQIPQLGTESYVRDLSWTVTAVPRPNKVPILVIRASTLSAPDTCEKKVAKKTAEKNQTRQLRSVLKHLRTRSCSGGIQHLRNLTPGTSVNEPSQRRIVKKMLFRQKPRFQRSVPMSLRSRNYISHTLRSHYSAPDRRLPHQKSSESSRKQPKSSSKLLAIGAENGVKIYPKLTERLCVPESLVSSVEHDALLLSSDSTPNNSLLANSLPHGSVSDKDFPEDSVLSDSDTVDLSPYSSMDAVASVGSNACLEASDSIPKNASSFDLLPYDAGFKNSLQEDSLSSDNTVELSPHSPMDVNFSVTQDTHSIPSDTFQKNALSVGLFPCDAIFKNSLQDDCPSSVNTVELSPISAMYINSDNQYVHSVPSDSYQKSALAVELQSCDGVFNFEDVNDCELSDTNTIAFSPHSSIDSPTIVYRSPISDVRFDFDELSLDQLERTEGSLEDSRKSDVCKDQELKPPSDLDCVRADSQPLPITVSGSVQSSGNLVRPFMPSKSLSCILDVSCSVNAGRLQSAPLELSSVNNGQETQKKCELAAPSAEFALESSRAGPEKELTCRGKYVHLLITAFHCCWQNLFVSVYINNFFIWIASGSRSGGREEGPCPPLSKSTLFPHPLFAHHFMMEESKILHHSIFWPSARPGSML